MEALNQARPLIGARGVGLAQRAMDLAIEFVRNRRAFGRTVSDFLGVRWMIADMAIQIEAARNLVYRARVRGHRTDTWPRRPCVPGTGAGPVGRVHPRTGRKHPGTDQPAEIAGSRRNAV
jgi:alkylation response protein AidB-like acyl-CoA dehydrogenase